VPALMLRVHASFTLDSLCSHLHPPPVWLDVSTHTASSGDSTGTESYFTTFENFEIMFHVSTLLPLLPNDPSRVRVSLLFPLFLQDWRLICKFMMVYYAHYSWRGSATSAMTWW
jgi:hypothetical protein